MAPWMWWIAGGFLLGTVEILAPGYVFLGFAAGAVLTGGLLAVLPDIGLPVTLVIWSVLSLAAWLALRTIFTLPGKADKPKIWDRDINDER